MALFRWKSGSVIVPSVSHGIWNAVAYAFYGTGVEAGALGIQDTAIYGAEVGIVGLGLNVVLAVVLRRLFGSAKARAVANPIQQPTPAATR